MECLPACLPVCQDALSYARPTAALVYVGKRGGKAESLKQPQIDQIIVDLCSQVRSWKHCTVIARYCLCVAHRLK